MPDGANICREGENTIAGMKIPIIFVPGIMGSRVSIPSRSDAWDPDSPIKNMYWHWSKMSAADKRTIMGFANPGTVMVQPSNPKADGWTDDNRQSRINRGWGGVRWASYGSFLTPLENWKFGSNQTPVYAYGYDWRNSILQLGCELAADITGQTVSVGAISAGPTGRFGQSGILALENADKCIIVTHSMGGLVTRIALQACAALQSKVAGVLHGVQPATGAPVMYRRLITGLYAPYDGSGSTEDNIFDKILGTTGDDFSTLASVIPGAVQLMPSDLYSQAVKSYTVGMINWTCFEDKARLPVYFSKESVYTTYKRPHTDNPPGGIRSTLAADIQSDLSDRFDGLAAFHQVLQSWKLTGKTWAFYGASRNTDYMVTFDMPPKSITTNTSGGVFGFGATTTYTATDPYGVVRTLDYERDILRNGFTAQVYEGITGKSMDSYAPRGDGTVPEPSGSALFDSSVTAYPGTITNSNYQFDHYSQYGFDGLEHEPAYRDSSVQDLVQAWLYYVIASIPRTC